MLLEVSGLPHLSVAKSLVTHRRRYHKKLPKTLSPSKKNYWGGHFGVFGSFWIEKLCETGVLRYFKFFVWQYRKNSQGNLSLFLKVSGIEKNLCTRGGITIFHRELFVSQCRKFSKKGSFGVCEYLPVLGINCTDILENIMPGKAIWGKSRKILK